MASLNFPPTTPDVPGPEYTLNGVVYYWDGEKWTANNEDGFTEVFVNVDGDNMTGDLTLGGDKITLNATDGSVSFAGNVNIGSQSLGSATGAAGILEVADGRLYTQIDGASTANTVDALRIYHGSTPTTTVRADGSATFAGNVAVGGDTAYVALDPVGAIISRRDGTGNAFAIKQGGDAVSDITAAIESNGSASFAGDVQVGPTPSTTAKLGAQTNSTGWTGFLRNTNTSGGGLLIETAGEASSTTAFKVKPNGGTDKVVISADGSAEFANKMRIHSEGTVSTARGMTIGDVNGNTANPTRFYIDNSALASSPGTHVLRWNSATGQVTVDATLPFDNNITAGNITFNLEPDNDAYYTATTDAEGNETRVYNGPTLDVKAVIQDLQQRVNDRDAVIADLTTRIQTLEGGNN